MDRALRANMKELIKAKRGFEFEAFVHEFHLIQYGDLYQPTRERKDDGAEGLIISSRTIIAAYAPDAYDEKKFLKKINDDFGDYIKKWAKDNPNWNMFYNNALAPEQLRVADSLKSLAESKFLTVDAVIIKGIDQIIHIIERDFTNTQQRQLANYLSIPKELLIFDHIRSIIDDLIRSSGIDRNNIEYKIEINVGDKIKLNYTEADVRNAEEEYIDLTTDGTLKKIWGIISTYEPEQINSLKLKIKREFNDQNGSFKEKINLLTQKYLDKYASGQDDDFEYYTRALLVYCFEQCMIGEKIIKEKEDQNNDNTTS
jgi:hypothetical protein